MFRRQVKLGDPLVTHGPYLSTLAVVLPIIRHSTNNQITYACFHTQEVSDISVGKWRKKKNEQTIRSNDRVSTSPRHGCPFVSE